MLNSQLQEAALLSAILNFKATGARRPVWVSAEDMAPLVNTPVMAVAEMMRRLEMQGYLEVEPNRMYGSPTATEKQRYGLSHDGARRAAYYDPMQQGYTNLLGQVLVAMHFGETKDNLSAVTAKELHERFHYDDLVDILRVLRSLQGQGYVKPFAQSWGAPEDVLYHLTTTGHQVAAYYHREGRFPPPAAVGGGSTTTYNLNAPNSRVNNNSTDSSTNTTNYHYGVDALTFTQAVLAFRDALQQVQDADERELGELRLSQLERVVQEGKSPEAQWERFFSWASGSASLVTGGAVLWNLGAAVGKALGYDVPEAPQGLGQ